MWTPLGGTAQLTTGSKGILLEPTSAVPLLLTSPHDSPLPHSTCQARCSGHTACTSVCFLLVTPTSSPSSLGFSHRPPGCASTVLEAPAAGPLHTPFPPPLAKVPCQSLGLTSSERPSGTPPSWERPFPLPMVTFSTV